MKNKVFDTAITFDDVLLVPGKSSVLPREAELKTRLTKNIDIEYTAALSGNGYSYGGANGYCNGTRRRDRDYTQKYDH